MPRTQRCSCFTSCFPWNRERSQSPTTWLGRDVRLTGPDNSLASTTSVLTDMPTASTVDNQDYFTELIGDFRVERAKEHGKAVKISSGSSALVFFYMFKHKKVAIKEFKKDATEYIIHRERDFGLKLPKHPSLVNILHFIEMGGTKYLIMEYVKGTELKLLIDDHFNLDISDGEEKRRRMRNIFIVMRDIVSALKIIHANQLLYRDLKVENIVTNEDTFHSVLVDMGYLQMKPHSSEQERRLSICGSPKSMSPEILKGDEYDEGNDLWGLGVMLYELCVGKPPFSSRNVMEVINMAKKVDYKIPVWVPNEIGDLIKKILVEDRSKRISLKQVEDAVNTYK